MEHSLVQVALYGVFIIIGVAAGVLIFIDNSPDVDLEVRKIRFGAAILTGILLFFILVSVMYFSAPQEGGAASIIFEKTLTALSPIIGVLIPYFFSTKK